MKLLEEYKELVERDADEISRLWKYAQMFLYLLCAISGYICSVLFYVLTEEIFGGNCPLWSTCSLISDDELESNDEFVSKEELESNVAPDANTIFSNWWRYIVTDYDYEITCIMYLTTCFLSCMFGVVWFTLFLMCGRGGYDVAAAYENSWGIVFPAIVFNFLFSIISIFAHYNLEEGYDAFKSNVNDVFTEIHNASEITIQIPDRNDGVQIEVYSKLFTYGSYDKNSDCEVVKTYMKMNSVPLHYMCDIMVHLRVYSAVMMCSWIGGLIILLLRVTMIDDFRILRVKIYEAKGK